MHFMHTYLKLLVPSTFSTLARRTAWEKERKIAKSIVTFFSTFSLLVQRLYSRRKSDEINSIVQQWEY